MRHAWIWLLLCGLYVLWTPVAFSQTFWIYGGAGISPDSGVAHGDVSVVGDRKDLSLRYQPDVLGIVFNYHSNRFHSALDQESFTVDNSVYGVGLSIKTLLVDENSGLWGGLHLVSQVAYQRGRSDAHVFNGPAGGVHNEVAADIYRADGVAAGVDAYQRLFYGAWVSAGAGIEHLGFQYQVPTDPNGDGRVNIRRTFSYLRAGLAVSF